MPHGQRPEFRTSRMKYVSLHSEVQAIADLWSAGTVGESNQLRFRRKRAVTLFA